MGFGIISRHSARSRHFQGLNAFRTRSNFRCAAKTHRNVSKFLCGDRAKRTHARRLYVVWDLKRTSRVSVGCPQTVLIAEIRLNRANYDDFTRGVVVDVGKRVLNVGESPLRNDNVEKREQIS